MKLFHFHSVSCNFAKVQRASAPPSISLIVLLLATVLIIPSFASAEVRKEYYQNGKLKLEGNYVRAIKEGKHKEFHENGELWLELNYKNGKLRVEENYKNGNLIGIKQYDESGKLIN